MYLLRFLFSLVATLIIAAPAFAAEFGRLASEADIKAWNIDVLPDGTGLPEGHGTVVQGRKVFAENCAACHGNNGEGGTGGALSGGAGTLASDRPVKTIGSFWPYSTTLFDYVRRAMPYPTPGSLSDDETYAVVAYLLNLNGILPENATLDRSSLPRVTMPNLDGFVPDREFSVIHNSR